MVRSWLKQIGDVVSENDPLVELETDKVTQEVPSPAAGVLAEILLDTDAEALPGALLARIEPGESATFEPTAASNSQSHLAASAERPASISPGKNAEIETRLSPSVRRACLQNGIDPSRLLGTGRNGRVTREDVDRAIASKSVVSAGGRSAGLPQQFVGRDIPHDRMRLTIAENMARAVAEQRYRHRHRARRQGPGCTRRQGCWFAHSRANWCEAGRSHAASSRGEARAIGRFGRQLHDLKPWRFWLACRSAHHSSPGTGSDPWNW